MAWLSKTKSLTITQTTDHKCTTPGTIGQAPAQTNISFTPFDLFGAAARCSHLHYVDPTAVTPESLIAKALIEHYVDDTSTDFSILSTADKLKDFVKSSFVGTVAAAVSYLTMIRNGYQWTDHFENVTGGNSGVTRAPDFVFAGQGKGHPLVESKGTRAQGHGAFNSRVEPGYLQQVEPHLGYLINNIVATHGYCIGSWLTSTSCAEILIHHTAVPVTIPAQPRTPLPLTTVQRHNYSTAFQLVRGASLGRAVRQGEIPKNLTFIRFKRYGHNWLTGLPCMWPPIILTPKDLWAKLWRDYYLDSVWRSAIFAIHETTAAKALAAFSRHPEMDERPSGLEPLSGDIIDEAMTKYTERPAAIFPDGLAVFDMRDIVQTSVEVRWDGQGFRQD